MSRHGRGWKDIPGTQPYGEPIVGAKNGHITSFLLHKDDYKRLCEFSDMHNVTRSSLMRRALRDILNYEMTCWGCRHLNPGGGWCPVGKQMSNNTIRKCDKKA